MNACLAKAEKKIMKIRISIILNESGGYTAICPALPGCKCQGKTREEVWEKINETIFGYIASLSDFVPENSLLAISCG